MNQGEFCGAVLRAMAKVSSNTDDPRDAVMCSICIDKIDSRSILLPCFHQFCNKCIYIWVKYHGSCPICRNVPLYIVQNSNLHNYQEIALLDARSLKLRKAISSSAIAYKSGTIVTREELDLINYAITQAVKLKKGIMTNFTKTKSLIKVEYSELEMIDFAVMQLDHMLRKIRPKIDLPSTALTRRR